MPAALGTRGETQVTSILSDLTWLKPKSVGAGTAVAREKKLDSECVQKVMLDLYDLFFLLIQAMM